MNSRSSLSRRFSMHLTRNPYRERPFPIHILLIASGWLARDLQYLLGYIEWRNFINTVISKAKTACEVSGQGVSDHFVDVNKMVDLGSGSQREVDDLMLARYACYLIAQNGDSRKSEIAFAQTRRAELIEQRLLEAERVCKASAPFEWLRVMDKTVSPGAVSTRIDRPDRLCTSV